MAGPRFHCFEGRLEVVHGPSAAGAGHVFGFIKTPAGSLEQLVGQIGSQSGGIDIHGRSCFIPIGSGKGNFIQLFIQQAFAKIASGVQQQTLTGRSLVGGHGLFPFQLQVGEGGIEPVVVAVGQIAGDGKLVHGVFG